MCTVTNISYPSTDGKHTVFACEWTPEGAPRGVVQIIHGMAEYIERYDEVARFLAGQGFVVVGEDHLGHGKTAGEGEFGFLAEENGGDVLAEDVHALQVATQAKYPDVPYFLLGHSLGSFLARYLMIRWPGSVSGVILSGTGHLPPALVRIAAPLAGLLARRKGRRTPSTFSFDGFNKKFAPVRTIADWISRDEAIVDAYVVDPLCQFPITYGMAHDMMVTARVLGDENALAKMDRGTPVYLFSGDRDPVGGEGKGVRKVHAMFARHGFEDLQIRLYEDGRHEMLNEINRQDVYADVLAWLEGHLG